MRLSRFRALLALPVPLLGLVACAPTPSAAFFTPGVEGRDWDQVCTSTSPECQRWTELARQCEEYKRRRDEGYMRLPGPFWALPARITCYQTEAYREEVTGIPLSTDKAAYRF